MKSLRIGWSLVRAILSHPLSRGRRLGALFTAFRFQLRTVVAKLPQRIVWIDECHLAVGKGDYSLTPSVYFGLSEFEEQGFLLHVARPEDLFIDVGANLGGWTVLASGAVGCETIAIEPVRGTFDRLVRQIESNELGGKVLALQIGLSEFEGELSFTKDFGTTNHVVRTGESGSHETVNVQRLDNLGITRGRKVHLKIDTEGFEMNVLRSGERLLESGDVFTVVVETNDYGRNYGHSNDDIHFLLSRLGFVRARYDPLTREIMEWDGVGFSYSDNSLYVSDLESAQESVRESKSYKLHTAGGLTI